MSGGPESECSTNIENLKPINVHELYVHQYFCFFEL